MRFLDDRQRRRLGRGADLFDAQHAIRHCAPPPLPKRFGPGVDLPREQMGPAASFLDATRSPDHK